MTAPTIYKAQILGGTHLDRQNEKLSKSQLERLIRGKEGKRLPLYAHHDMSKMSVGYYENLRIEPDASTPGEWHLVAEVTVERGSLEEAIGGFSIGFLETISLGNKPDIGNLYIPYPLYNDSEFIAALRGSGEGGIGKWVKKGLGTAELALIFAGFYFLLKPFWDQVYEATIKDNVAKVLNHFRPAIYELKEKRVGVEYLQRVKYGTEVLEVRFIPDQADTDASLTPEKIMAGYKAVYMYLIVKPPPLGSRVDRIILVYDRNLDGYAVDRVEYSS